MLIVIIYKPAECLYGLICQYVLCTTGILVCCFFAYTDELQKLADGVVSVQIFVAFPDAVWGQLYFFIFLIGIDVANFCLQNVLRYF